MKPVYRCNAFTTIAILLLFCLYAFGYPEIGFLGKLENNVARSTVGWQKISNWKTSLTDVKGLYNFDASLASSGDISIPVTGIYFVSVALPVANADTGLFQAALVINDVTADKSLGLSCRMENMTSGTQMLNFAGFLNLRAGENVAVYAYSSSDIAWSIKSQSSFTFHYFGRYGSTPAFLAHPMSSMTLTNPKSASINTWRTTGRGGLFQSLTGLTKSNGKFTTVCTGVYILTANIIFEGEAGEYSLSTLFNLKSSIVGTTRMIKRGLATVNVYQAFSLPKGTAVDIGITSNAGSITILGQSSWSMAFIGATSANTKEFASYLTSPVQVTGGQWSELSGLLRDSATQTAMGSETGQLIQPSNLALTGTKNFVITDQTELYYAFVHLAYSGNVTNVELMMAVSANKATATGKEGIYGSMTTVAQQSGSMSLSGIVHIRKQEHLSIFISSSSSQDRFTVQNTSFVSFIRMRYVVSAFNARIQTKMVFQKSGWNEITGPWLTETYGLFSYGKDFSATTGRFTASHTGVYIVAANIKINKGDGAEIGVALVKNGKVDLNNGFYAVNGEPSAATTLNVYGTVYVKTGEQLSLFGYKGTAADWEVDIESGFSITYIGPNWAANSFHAVLANDNHLTTRGPSVEIDGWIANSSLTDMTFMNNAGFSSKRYTSQVDGVYVVSANILVRNVSIAGSSNGAGTFTVQALVNGYSVTSIGLEDTKPSFAENTRDYFSLSFSGAVRIKKGQYISVFITSSADSSYVLSKQSGFSVVLVSIYSHSHNQGLLGSKDVISYITNPQTWTGVVDISTSVTVPGRFVAGSGLVTTPTIHYSVNEPGIYYVTGNFRFENAGDGSLFEVHAEIDSQSSVTYGLYAVESAPKGKIYNLNFAGALYLTFGQQVKIMLKTTKTNFDIGAGSSFSIIKIQLDEHFPGFVVDKYDSSFSANQLLTNWEETTKPGLLTSNVGYNAVQGTYKPPVSGIYIASINNYISTASDTTSISLIDPDNANTIKAYGSIGDNRTMLATSALYLDSNKSISYQLNSTTVQSPAIEAGWSVYFIKTRNLIEGFSGRLSGDFIVSNAGSWMTVSNWTNSSWSDFSAGSAAQMDSYTARTSGAYFISFSSVANHSSAFNLKISVKINSSSVMVASLDNIPASKQITLPVSGTVKLNAGDVVEFQVYCSLSGVLLTTETTRSLIFVEGITTNTEGVAAQKTSDETLSGTKTTPKQLNNFIVGNPGTFMARNGTLTNTGSFVNFHPGIFLYTTNVMVLNSAASPRKFHLYSVINKEAESSFSLQSIQTIDANKEGTLSLSSSMFLPRFSQVETLISASDDGAFQILENSTYTFILIDDNTGPVICEDQGLNMERLTPSAVRISTDKSVTFTCAVVGSIPATLSWFKNGVVISGHSSTTYTVNPTKISDSASYACKATYQSLTAITNNASLSVYDPTPSISASAYNKTLPENLAGGSVILQNFVVSAKKYAVGQPALVSCSIVSGDPNGDFTLSSPSTSSITITTSRPLDYEKKSFYSLTITAVNSEEADAKNTTIIFNITVTDLNDNAPVFNPQIVYAAVPEDLPVGNVVVKATATDSDSGVFGIVTYNIIGNLSRPFFDINSTTGEITLKKSLDRETEDTYVIIVEARDQLFSSVAEVVVNVTDVNDNMPRFNPVTYSLDVVENILSGSSIIQVFSSDPDLALNSSMVFSILSGNNAGYFAMDSSTGVISLVKGLNYETNTMFTLTIGLSDRGSPVLQSSTNATVTINVKDINDNYAVFEKSLYTASIPENINISTYVLQVKATDKDGTMKNRNLTYSFNDTLASDAFTIGLYTGEIRVKTTLDYEKSKEYRFCVIATDNGTVPYTRHTNVIIYVTDVNDEAPYFQPTSYNLTISEFTRPGTIVLQLFGFDNDTRKSLQYSITSQSPKQDFSVGYSSGELLTRFDLDRENITLYTLTISLSDGVNMASVPATVTLHISDENDNKPIFPQANYKTELYENASIGAFVVQVQATDQDIGSNAALTYSILHTGLNDSSLFFSINASTGSISLAKSLNYEQQSVHRIVVVATDGGRVALQGHTTVEVRVLDTNDNMPYFSPNSYSVNIAESMNIGNVVAVIHAYDNDSISTSLTYEIVEGNTFNHFRFMQGMPNVISTAAVLDYENITMYALRIRAFDGVFYSVTNATLNINITDVNDNNPIFNQTYYTVTIPENTNPSAVIMQVLATDKDSSLNGQIRYLALENTTAFTLNPTSGEIAVNKIDYEMEKYYSLVVIAEDYGTPSRQAHALVDIIITDFNDNAPIFSPTLYHANVSEAAILGVQIATVKATDADSGVNGELVFSIIDGNNGSKFAIDSSTGVVSLASHLNYEDSVKMYNLSISVADKAGMSAVSNATVIVNIFDINDNQPIFDISQYTKTISENTQIGSSLLTVHAADRDGSTINSDLKYYIVTSGDSGNFSINSTTGVISSLQLFDYESRKYYGFEVEARDTGNNMLTGRCLVTVEISDINDNAPVPDMLSYKLNVSKQASVGSQILTIFATDKDSGMNGQLQYSFTAGNTGDTFTINNKGVIMLAKVLENTLFSYFQLMVMIKDQGVPSLNVNVSVLINVTDIPTSSIAFEQRQYIFSINESTLLNHVGQIKAKDTGNTTSKYIQYEIIANANNVNGIFYLNPSTGDIYMNSSTNFEARGQYDFSVRATSDLGNTAFTHVTIKILDVNEMPFFLHTVNGFYHFNVSESAAPYTFIHSVFAQDNDTGLNGQLTYSLVVTAFQNTFFIDQQGRIYSKVALDFESTKQYMFQVQVEDKGNPSLRATVNVTIDVLDVNDNHPVFVSPTPQNITVLENSAKGTQVGILNATDADSTNNGVVEFVGIYPAGILTVNQTTGVLQIDNASYFDHEKTQTSELIALVKDLGSPHLMTSKTIKLIIENINDNDPYFINSFYNISVSEVTEIGSIIIPLHAMDNDLGVAGTIESYSIVSGDTSKFSIDNSGKITLKAKLSYSENSSYHLVINATDNGTPNRTGQANVYINVLDFSKLQPTFLHSTYYKTVQENNNLGENLIQVNATTAEVISGPLLYSIVSNSKDSQYFTIDNTTGIIKNLISFDYENQKMFTFTVKVLDSHNQKTGISHVVIYVTDLNDNTPIFTNKKQMYNISEATSIGTLIMSLSAADNDSLTNGMVRFSAVSGDGMNKFTVESDGRIYLKSAVDAKVKNSYTLTVKVEDMGVPSLHTNITLLIHIDPASLVHLSQPVFNQTSYVKWVDEGITNLPFVALVVNATNQAISSSITYSLVGRSSEINSFNITASGEINAIVKFEYAVKSIYTFQVKAVNTQGRSALASVTIYIRDVNNKSPVFMPATYQVDISECALIGQKIVQLLTKDNDTEALNSKYTYTIESGNAANKFNVSSTGEIMLVNSIDYDTMNGNSYTLVVSVKEGSNPKMSNATVVINISDANDLAPVFIQSVYTFNVSEAAALFSSVGILAATDNDRTASNNMVTFSLVTDGGVFSLSSDGNLTIRSKLNYATSRQYDLVAVATDNGSPSLKTTAIIRINVQGVNDQHPYFKQTYYQSNISEAFPVGGAVISVRAYDDDTGVGGSISYNITDNSGMFKVDAAGRVVLLQRLNFESKQSYSLLIDAIDGGGKVSKQSATVFVRITEVNDNQPQFSLSYYVFDVVESTIIGSVVGQVMASDLDRTENSIDYTVVSNQDSGNFTIHSNGSITLAANLDYESITRLTFMIKATDQGSPALSRYASVVINVLDQNDNAPVFAASCNNTISVASPVGMTVLVCSATDRDISGALVYTLNNTDLFTVDNGGKISLKKRIPFTSTTVYNLTLTASDGVHSSSTVVKVTVVALILCRPLFNQSLYIGYIREDSHIQTSVLTVAANDSVNSTLTYSIEAGVTAFSVGVDGLIKTNKLLDYNVKNMYMFKVYATGGSYTAESVVVVNIIDINNKLPIPGKLAYNVQISEKAAIGAIVIGINASDPDTNSKFTYSISSGNTLNSFRIDSGGRVLVNRALDYELLPSYKLLVKVSDGVHSTPVPINIQVLDVNEPTTCGPCLACPPVSTFDFKKPAYRTKPLSENTTVGSVVTKIGLNDAAMNNLITGNYSIEDATAKQYFAVNNTGDVTLIKMLDAATLISLKKFSFPVYNQFKCRKDSTEIIIDSTLSDCPLQFSKYHYETSINEDYPLNQVFLTVTTKPFSSSASFAIVENNMKSMFSINSASGGISLISRLNYEITKRHQFTVMVNVTNLISYVSVIVNVLDVNDNCPQLAASNTLHYQPVQLGTIVGYIMMNDSDSFQNHSFAITAGDTNNNFTVDNNGILRARTVITSVSKSIFSLTVTVSDGVCSRNVPITVVVSKDTPPPCPTPPSCYNYTCAPCATTQPLTKCPSKFCPGCPVCPTTSAPCPTTKMTTACPVKTCPTCPKTCPATVTCSVCPTLHCPSCPSFTAYIFKKAFYSVDVYENRTTPSNLLTVHINGAMQATYSIVTANASSLFSIDPSTGKISLISSLNYSMQKTHRFTVRATIGSEYSDAVVQVNVLDVNNQCPVFSQSQVNARLTSPVESGTIIAINKANDADIAPALVYSITSGDSAGDFTVDNEGVIKTQKRVVIAGSKTFNLTITVTDGVCSVNSHAIIVIHLDTMFTVTPSKCPVFCPVCPLCTAAPTTTNAPCQNVTKTSNQSCPACPSQCTTCLSPAGYMFAVSHYWTTLKENTSYSSPILTVRLSGSIAANFSIVEANALSYFKINRTTGELMLRDVLDYEKMTKHNFTIRASFAGGFESQVAVTIYVSNINDNNPYFVNSSYLVKIHEYTEAGALVVHVLASDMDDKNSVRFSISSGNTNNLFNINSNSGVISLAKQPYLFTQNKYQLLIGLSDTGNLHAVANAIVTVHIERLTASKAGCAFYGSGGFVSTNLAENSPIGTIVANIPGTPVTAVRNIRYTITNPEAMSLFKINATTGEVTSKALLNYESKISHVIVVNAQDPVTNITSVAFIYVNVTNIDESALIFGSAPASVSVSELASISTYVAQVRATDADSNSQITHRITAGNNGGYFVIDPVNGVIRLNKSLNHDSAKSLMLTVCASDAQSGSQACHNMTVNVKNENNKNIVFTQTSYTSAAVANASVGTIVVNVSASDPDNLGPLTFTIDGIVANEHFTIDSFGVVKIKKSLSGSGLPSPYVLMVCVANSGNPPTKQCVPVIVNTGSGAVLVEANNYDPYFIHSSFNSVINENVTVGTTVMKLAAADNDTGMAGVVFYNPFVGAGNDYFLVNEHTGVVTTSKVLNTLATPKAFFFTMNVRDHGTPVRYSARSVKVTIAILSPTFVNNTITSTSSLTMDVLLSKDPFIDSKIVKYEVVAQEYAPSVSNFVELTSMSAVSWYFVNYIPATYKYRRFIVATFTPSNTTARRKRREVLENKQNSYVKYRVGNQQGCELMTLEGSICNGPLKPGNSYRYQLVGYYADNNPVTGAFTSPSPAALSSISAATGVVNSAYVATYWIIGLVVLSLMFFIAVLVIVVILCYKKRYRVYDMGAKTFENPMYGDQPPKKSLGERDNLNFYATDNVDGYSSVASLKNKEASPHVVDPEEFEMIDHQPIGILGPQHSFQNYETVSDQVTFEEENPEWESMEISLKVDPTGKNEPIIMTGERASDSSGSKKASVSSDSSRDGKRMSQHAPPDYDDVPAEVNSDGVRISVVEDDGYNEVQGITKL